MQPTEPRYCPQVFDQPDLADAKAIILTPEAGLTTDERWERETAFLRPFLEALPAGLAIDVPHNRLYIAGPTHNEIHFYNLATPALEKTLQ